MIVLGFDVSLASTGWAALHYEDGDLAGHGIIATDPATPFVRRLREVRMGVRDVMRWYPGANVAMEDGVSYRSGEVTRKLACAWGVAAEAIHTASGRDGRDPIEPFEVNIGTLKKLATGSGAAKKEAVMAAAAGRWGELLSADEADAAWCAEVLRLELLGRFG